MGTKLKLSKKNIIGAIIACGIVFLLWELFVPYSLAQKPAIIYTIEKGESESTIAADLQKQGIIASNGIFKAYLFASGLHGRIQAGQYNISPSMSLFEIVRKFTTGDVIKNIVTIVGGWDLQDIGIYLQSKGIASEQDFLALSKQDFSASFDFLKDKPKKATLEGYLFPDTYQISIGETGTDIAEAALANFGAKLTPSERQDIAAQHKTIFQIVTMASIIEKEVRTPDDKKIVSGVLWKRIANGMPLQVDATINYITGKNDPSASTRDTLIDSPYNTYRYKGLPQGPICNPGMDSILAAIYPTQSPYWYYLSDPKTGKTIFSKTLQEQSAAINKYLKS